MVSGVLPNRDTNLGDVIELRYGSREFQQVAYYVARDRDKAPLTFAGAAVFGQFAVLFNLLSHPGLHPLSSWARYQLHTFLALDLGGSGVRYLLVGSALRESAGNQYFQHLLGYRVRNLRVKIT